MFRGFPLHTLSRHAHPFGIQCCLAFALLCGAGAPAMAQPAEYYKGDRAQEDLIATAGVVVFDTTEGTMIGSFGLVTPFTIQATEVAGNVPVFRFRNVHIPEEASITVEGDRPLVIAADQDFYLGAGINVAGTVAGRGGGGIGGAGGSGA